MKITLRKKKGVPQQIVKHELQYDDFKTGLAIGDITCIMIFTPVEALTIHYTHFIVITEASTQMTTKAIFQTMEYQV